MWRDLHSADFKQSQVHGFDHNMVSYQSQEKIMFGESIHHMIRLSIFKNSI